MYLKGVLFLATLIISITLILLETFSYKLVLLLALVVWSAARLYYFMFYVIEKYIDPTFKFSGIFSFIKYLMKTNK